jgi:hypothetical protein
VFWICRVANAAGRRATRSARRRFGDGVLQLESGAMEDMKVSLESLYTNKVKEIDYEGEEHYQERSSFSQHVTELAQRVDFSEVTEGKEGEPAVKKATQKWPWEQPHSKLKQALTEVSVLADVLHILHDHRHYMAMDTVAPRPPPSLPLAFQYLVKKKALARAAEILKRGTEALTHSSSREERAFHRALAELRRRWRVRRAPNGNILGDLGYSTAGSTHVPQSRAIFEVKKSTGQESSQAVSQPPTEEQGKEKEILSITIFRELRGSSEVVIFLSPSPVRACESMSAAGTIPCVPPRRLLPSWETKILAAQNIIFNQELFSHLTKEAYNTKTTLPYEVYTDRIIVPLSLNPPCWLSIHHVREYDDNKQKLKPVVVPSELPPVRWDLVVAAKLLLRQRHLRSVALFPPRPTSTRYTDNPTLQNAGANALSDSQIKAADKKDNIFQSLLKMGKHVHNEERLRQWLVELVGSSRGDPVLQLHWVPSLSMTETAVYLHIKSEGGGLARSIYSCKVFVCVFDWLITGVGVLASEASRVNDLSQ